MKTLFIKIKTSFNFCKRWLVKDLKEQKDEDWQRWFALTLANY